MATRKQNVSPIYLEPGDTVTCIAAAAITGSRFVKLAAGGVGNRPSVTPGTAGSASYGVAEYDAAKDAAVPVKRVGTHGVKAGETLEAGDPVSVGAAGVAMKATAADFDDATPAWTAASLVVGTCVADTANGAVAPITLAL